VVSVVNTPPPSQRTETKFTAEHIERAEDTQATNPSHVSAVSVVSVVNPEPQTQRTETEFTAEHIERAEDTQATNPSHVSAVSVVSVVNPGSIATSVIYTNIYITSRQQKKESFREQQGIARTGYTTESTLPCYCLLFPDLPRYSLLFPDPP
jgi:hypothetical protein